jgi:hypothetical protein
VLATVPPDPAAITKRDIAVALLDADVALSMQDLQEFYVQATRVTRLDVLSDEIAFGLVRTWLRFVVREITLPVMIGALKMIKATSRLPKGRCDHRCCPYGRLSRASLRGHDSRRPRLALSPFLLPPSEADPRSATVLVDELNSGLLQRILHGECCFG